MHLAVVCVCFFFCKQKTAYEMLRSLVGEEMCIRDRDHTVDDLIQMVGIGLRDLTPDEFQRVVTHLSLIHI